jgi:hypothetical protein
LIKKFENLVRVAIGMLKKVLGFREQFNYLADILRPHLRSEQIPKGAGLGFLFIQIKDLKTGSSKGVNRNRITVDEIDADCRFKLSPYSFQFRDFDFGLIHLVRWNDDLLFRARPDCCFSDSLFCLC